MYYHFAYLVGSNIALIPRKLPDYFMGDLLSDPTSLSLVGGSFEAISWRPDPKSCPILPQLVRLSAVFKQTLEYFTIYPASYPASS
jgi:hypothetical protein